MTRSGDETRQRARDIRDEALSAAAERNRASLTVLLDEVAALRAMMADQQRQLLVLTELVAGLTGAAVPPVTSSSARPLNAAKRHALERIRELRAQDLSFAQICDIFHAEHVPTLSGDGQWSKGTLWNLWKNHAHQLDLP